MLSKENIDDAGIPEVMEKVRREVNAQLAPYERIAEIEVMHEEFRKTPKRSIKRFLYT